MWRCFYLCLQLALATLDFLYLKEQVDIFEINFHLDNKLQFTLPELTHPPTHGICEAHLWLLWYLWYVHISGQSHHMDNIIVTMTMRRRSMQCKEHDRQSVYPTIFTLYRVYLHLFALPGQVENWWLRRLLTFPTHLEDVHVALLWALGNLFVPTHLFLWCCKTQLNEYKPRVLCCKIEVTIWWSPSSTIHLGRLRS